jgi:molybdopterin guanine dinucleotide-containing S/N-oxide reductase-like protein
VREKENIQAEEKTFIKSTGYSAMAIGSHVAAVDVKDGRIVRIRPLPYEWKYNSEEFRPWKIEARGKTFNVPMKSTIGPFGLGYKKSIYSPNRILYPLKRVDWDPKGERNTHNRGKSGYVRISWDEALDILTTELKRVIDKYGPYAVFAQADGHGETKVVHGPHGCHVKLLKLLGGYTLQLRNPDSWEGWYWGTKHFWGGEPFGLMPNPTNIYPDISWNSELLLFWGCDPTTTTRGFSSGDYVSRFCFFWKDIGIKQIYVCPDLNYGAAVFADKWIPILPNTDAAMQLAIAYLWIVNDTYDKEYLDTHSIGFENFKNYVLGKEDGIPKTPKWASEKCKVPSRIIKALAREWAVKRTSIVHGLGGPYIRGAFSHETARLEGTLLAMQGLGKPGQHSFAIINRAVFGSEDHPSFPPSPGSIINNPSVNVRAAYRGYSPFPYLKLPDQFIPKTMVHDTILNGKFVIHGSSFQSTPASEQFIKYSYPAKGCSPIHMIWTDTPCLMTCWNDGNRNAEAYCNPSIEFFVAQHPWLENDCIFADLILPVNTKFEEEDIGDDTESATFEIVYLENKCIEPLGESKSDYEIVCMVAEKLGLLKEYTEGKTIPEWIKYGFDNSGIPDKGLITWKKFKENQYYVVPSDPDWEKHPAGMYEFYKNPKKNPLSTPSGLLEFKSLNLTEHFPDDMERPPVPHWVEKSDFHDERISSERVKDYPLLVMSNHPRWRVHAQLDDINWFHEIPTGKVIGPDNYHYEPVWINPIDAEKRGIKTGDVVNIFNERGQVLCGARVWERIMPGVIYVDHGSRYDPIVPGEIDRGGAINTICPHHVTSKNCAGMVTSGFLAQAKKANLDGLRQKYPEAFARPYDKGSGLKFERILAKGDR